MSSGTRRQCALCRQRFGSGFQENVGSSEILRARRMLIERNAPADGGGGVAAIPPPLKHGMDAFLSELSRGRALYSTPSPGPHQPLDACAFCTQFLPSTYSDQEADRKEEEERRAASAQLRASRPSHARPTPQSSLIIQHRPSARPPKRGGPASQPPPQPPPTFRLLSSDAARVLRIDASSSAADALGLSGGGERQPLGETGVLHDLGAHSRLESASILGANQLTDRSRGRFPNLRGRQSPPKAPEETRQARNSVLDARDGAGSLYTGVVRSLLLGRPPSASDAVAVASSLLEQQQQQQQQTRKSMLLSSKERARVVPTKHGRHWKTELRFPPTIRRLGAP